MIIEIKDKSVIHFIPIENILYCKAEGNYTCFVLRDKKILTYKTLKQISKRLKNYNFCRCHNSILVNLNEVIEFDIKKNIIILKNRFAVPVSLRKKDICKIP